MSPARPLWLLPLLVLVTALDEAAQAPRGNEAEICLLPPKVGRCRARIPRYYYDRRTQNCNLFYYGGCDGNANNFNSWEECHEACWMIEKVPKICRLEIKKDYCHGSVGRYYFNLSSMTCEKFPTSGYGCNKNRFPDKATCMGYCAPKKSPSYCYSPKDEGLCSANVTRYYFNPQKKGCDVFAYTGCGGNENNFVNLQDCRQACMRGGFKKEKKIKTPTYPFVKRRMETWKKKF
ncbi:tissue factor pathway inhibitor 2 isoform X1 [Ochotona princeps]|uniref:tissue factor pathway inhibitor 2 isoform X1 n=1 Tax=Ochotona princeps TaxID=9978 RepID=UPI0027146E09|nr:tissue factor pathway inhibitor 2 isoform X1 [Ochotona princeps]XP_058534239.1 tissue factor pathway inhibitor 2 isoform X1 [Ochotona princeps]XP_058534240.1 tissue factor pathway inhibitor 2 isoform X1 [Ochotona princeps]